MLDIVLHAHGPTFLLVFAAYAAIVIVGLQRWLSGRLSWERPSSRPAAGGRGGSVASLSPVAQLQPNDPFEAAFLVDGARGVIRAALASLDARGGFTRTATTLRPSINVDQNVLHAAEREVLAWMRDGDAARALYDPKLRRSVDVVMAPTSERLTRLGLLLPVDGMLLRFLAVMLTLVAVPGLAVVKMYSAALRGHHNIGLLALFAAASTVVILIVALKRPRLTERGQAALEALQTQLGAWSRRIATSARPSPVDVALLAGVFGLGALAGTPCAAMAQVVMPVTSGGSACSASCASGGSSCSSSCSSGCGGGGGGCGGCGGGGGD